MVNRGTLMAEGAEAKVYLTRLIGIDAVVKRRLSKRYREEHLDAKLRSERTKSEARIMWIAREAGASVPIVLLVDTHDIYMSRITGAWMAELLRKDIVTDETLEHSGTELGLLHSADIAHGDYTPANIIVKPNDAAFIIDFGLAEITQSTEAKAIDVLLMKRSLNAAQYLAFARGYRNSYKDAKDVLSRLAKVEARGRYKTRTLMTGSEATA